MSPSSANPQRHHIHWVMPRHTLHRYATMAMPEASFHNRQSSIASKIRSLLAVLTPAPSRYNDIAPKIEYWIEYAFRERLTTVNELVEGVSYVMWDGCSSCLSIGQFLKEFRDAQCRSEQARSFVDRLCERILQWFVVAAAEDLDECWSPIAGDGWEGLIRAASLVGRLIECGVLSHELVRRHLVKPLIAHYYTDHNGVANSARIMAIYKLFLAARNTLLQGLLEPEDVRACFGILGTKISLQVGGGPDPETLNVRYLTYPDATYLPTRGQELQKFHATWLKRKEEERVHIAKTEARRREEQEGGMTVESTAEIKTPIAFVPRDLPTTAGGIGIPPFANIPTTVLSSPTLSISTVSDLTPTELGEEVEYSEEQKTTRHDTFYFQDGNVEIVCGGTAFRVHSTIISFSSSKLRDILSTSTLLDAPVPEGCPRIIFNDCAEDFAVLLKMIYTPGHVSPPLNVNSAN